MTDLQAGSRYRQTIVLSRAIPGVAPHSVQKALCCPETAPAQSRLSARSRPFLSVKLTSVRKDPERECILTRRNVGYLNLKALLAPRPLDLRLRSKQFHLLNLVGIVWRCFGERPDKNLPVSRPAESYGIQSFTPGGESYVSVVELELRYLVGRTRFGLRRRTLPIDLPRARTLNRFGIDLLPFSKFAQK